MSVSRAGARRQAGSYGFDNLWGGIAPGRLRASARVGFKSWQLFAGELQACTRHSLRRCQPSYAAIVKDVPMIGLPC